MQDTTTTTTPDISDLSLAVDAAPSSNDAAVQQLLAAVADLPGAEWATPETCQRYLKARNGSVAKATEMLRASIAWRREFGVGTLVQDHHAQLQREGETGKLRVSEHTDKLGRPVLIMTPALENSKDHLGNLRNLVYNLERACAAAPAIEGSGRKIVVAMDFRGCARRGPRPMPPPLASSHHLAVPRAGRRATHMPHFNAATTDLRSHFFLCVLIAADSIFNAPPMKTARATLSILQDHYPERLHRFVLLHAPALFSGFFKMISPFIDPVTKAKIVFVTGSAATQAMTLAETVDLAKWEAHLGGQCDFVWSADAYFARDDAMVKAVAATTAAGASVVVGVPVQEADITIRKE